MSVRARLAWGLCAGVVLLAGAGCARRKAVIPEPEVAVGRPNVSALVAALDDPDPDIRFYAVMELAREKANAAPAVDRLTKLLSDPAAEHAPPPRPTRWAWSGPRRRPPPMRWPGH